VSVAPPDLDARVIEALLAVELGESPDRLVLVHGRFGAGARSGLSVAGRGVRIVEQRSVLGVHDAWLGHRDDDVLVVVHPLDDDELGWDLRGHALRRRTLTVDPAEIVQRRFDAADLDPRIRERPWLVDGLLAAEPPEGFRPAGAVLTLDVAVRALLAARLGLDATPDAGSMLAWSRGSGPDRFRVLPEAERAGLGGWLRDTVGPAVTVLLALAGDGRAADAMALGLVARVLDGPVVSAETAVAVGSLLGAARAGTHERRAFVLAVEGVLERWLTAGENGGQAAQAARADALAVLERADALAAAAGLPPSAESPFLPSAFQARLRELATTLGADPDPAAVDAASAALTRLRDHRLARLHPDRAAVAEMALRLLRALSTDPVAPRSVGAAVTAQLADGGWVDRALTAVWAGESVDDPVVGRAYRTVHDAVRARRDAQDEAFATLLVPWAAHATAAVPGGTLLVEHVLEEIVDPLAARGPAPLIPSTTTMSAAVAVELGEQLGERGWTEASRDAGRTAAVSTIPSVTHAARASLLSGTARTGDQAAERDAFTAFWRHRRRPALLVHKADIPGTAGRRLAEPIIEALADDGTVVAAVLNTVDDALDHGREGDRTGWRLADVTYLTDLLDAARGYGRPVVLLADHGHVLDRRGADGPTAATGVESARWRTGTPGPGEVAVTGPRVLLGDGSVVVPWREDVRYTRRRAGYHGGVALAEMTVPVLVFTPVPDQLPMGWSVLAPESARPAWWDGRRDVPAAPVAAARPARRGPRKPVPDAAGEGLFPALEPQPATLTLGQRVVATDVYRVQEKFVRRAPDRASVAATVDALAAHGSLSAAATAAALGRAGRDPRGVVATLQRLLNVEGYAVLSITGGTVELHADLLRLQFGVGP
jgi:PglZ domain